VLALTWPVKVRNGKMSTTDGAFCRSQGALGGFILIDAAVIQACSSGCDPDDDSHDDHCRLLTLQPIGEILKFSNEIHNIKPFAVVFVDRDRMCCPLGHQRSWQDSQ
jgi:hypothetical protein